MPGCVETALWLDELRREGKIDLLGGTNFDTARTAELVAAGRAARHHAGAVLPARRTVPSRGSPPSAGSTASASCATARWREGFSPTAGSDEPEPGAALRQPLARQVQADHRRFRRLGPVPGAAARAPRRRRPPWHRHRFGGEPQRSRQAGGRRSHRRRPRPLAPHRKRGPHRLSISPPTIRPPSPPCWRGASGPDGDTFSHERDRLGRHGSIMKYNLNAAAS